MRRMKVWMLAALVAGAWAGAAARGQNDGLIVAWGYNGDGECAVPAPNTGFVSVAAGEYHSLGLKADGSIVAWGGNWSGQCNVPAPNTDFVAVAGGMEHSLGLKANGSIMAWGSGTGSAQPPAPNTGFVAIAAGSDHNLGLKADGSIVAWGNNAHGQCNVPAPNSGFIAIAASYRHSVGLKSDGSIVAWGYNAFGQNNVPAPNTGFVAVAEGGYGQSAHSLGPKSDGSIVGWGINQYCQCNDVPPPNTGFVAVAAGENHSLGLKANGSIVAWGVNNMGQCNVPAPNTGFVAIAGGREHSLGLKAGASIVTANPPASNPYGPGVFRDVLQNTTGALAPQGIGVPGTPAEGPYTYAEINVTFAYVPSPAPLPSNIAVDCTDVSGNGSDDCPTVTSVTGTGVGPYRLTLSAAAPVRECTTFTFWGTSAGEKLKYQVLPGDTNLDGLVSAPDLLFLLQRISDGSANQPANLARFNINRSQESGGVLVNTQDLLRLVQLLNGVNSTQVFNGATVAACP